MNLIQYLKSKFSDISDKPNKSFYFTLSNGKDIVVDVEKPCKIHIKNPDSSELDVDEFETIVTSDDDLSRIFKEIDKLL